MRTLLTHCFYLKNCKGRDFFVGDIHGKHALLMQALQHLHFDSTRDRLFSVGDVIDRGEHSFACLLLAKEDWFMPVIGNHEQFLIEAEKGAFTKKMAWYQNGGAWWENLDLQEKRVAKKIVEENYSLTLSVDTLAGKVAVVHAQYPLPKWPLDKGELNNDILHQLLWSRDCIAKGAANSPIIGVDFIVSGHTPLSRLRLQGQQLFIDTGAGHLPNMMIPAPHLTLCEFKEGSIEFCASFAQGVEFSRIEI